MEKLFLGILSHQHLIPQASGELPSAPVARHRQGSMTSVPWSGDGDIELFWTILEDSEDWRDMWHWAVSCWWDLQIRQSAHGIVVILFVIKSELLPRRDSDAQVLSKGTSSSLTSEICSSCHGTSAVLV